MASRFSLFLRRTTTTRGFELRLARPSVLDILTDSGRKMTQMPGFCVSLRYLVHFGRDGCFWNMNDVMFGLVEQQQHGVSVLLLLLLLLLLL